jgi:hypothetical protein
MKSRIYFTSLMLAATFTLSACNGDTAPMTEADMAEKYGLTMQEYEQAKQDAAAMNMTVEQHLSEGHMDHDMMDHQ